MSNIDKLIEMMDKFTRSTTKASDRALFHLLKANRAKLPELNDYFHKAFRQMDVTGCGNTDMAIWHLLSESKLFWDLFGEVAEVNQ